MKKILILGAGVYQVPLIETAQKMGLETIVCSIKGNYPGFKRADKVYYIDTRNKKDILNVAINEEISGICTTGTDVAISTVGYVCDKLGLAGLSEAAGEKATDKAKMKKAFAAAKVKSAKFIKVHTLEEACSAYEILGPVAVLKVTDQSGSRGVKVIENMQMLKNVFCGTLEESQKDYLIVEEFIRGHEIGIDAFVENGKLLFIAPHDKITYNYGGIGIPIGHIFPYVGTQQVMDNIELQTKRVIKALELNNCAVNIDAFLMDNGDVSIIEAGARAGATGIPELISIAYNCDYYEMIIKNCINKKIDGVRYNGVNCASRLIISEKAGTFLKLNTKNEKKVIVKMDVNNGDRVEKFVNGTCRIGQAIIVAHTKNDLELILQNFDEYVSAVIED